MEAFVTAGAGFLLAVLWFDLMHDVLVRDTDPAAPVPEERLTTIAGYYARVTTDARPMNLLVAATMLATLGAVVVQIVRGSDPTWVPWVSLAGVLVGVGLAGARVVRDARRLGARTDDAIAQSTLARSIYRDHLVCFVAIATVLVVQLVAAAT